MIENLTIAILTRAKAERLLIESESYFGGDNYSQLASSYIKAMSILSAWLEAPDGIKYNDAFKEANALLDVYNSKCEEPPTGP